MIRVTGVYQFCRSAERLSITNLRDHGQHSSRPVKYRSVRVEMSFLEKKRSLTSEIADETTKKNGFEERRLQKRLQDIERNALKQQKKRSNEQLEYALENLSLEDVNAFNSLTRKILKSSFLPPINQKPAGGSGEGKRGNRNEILAERLRGSRMIHSYLDKQKQRWLTRSLSVDSGLIPLSGNRTVEETELKPGPYSAFVKRQLAGSLSDVSCPTVFAGAVTNFSHVAQEGRKFEDIKSIQNTRRVDFADDIKEQLERSRSKPTLRKRQSNHYLSCQTKIQHSCLSDAIVYKLEMRKRERLKLYQQSGDSYT